MSETVLGKEKVSEEYSVMQQHDWHKGKIHSWSNMQLNDLSLKFYQLVQHSFQVEAIG